MTGVDCPRSHWRSVGGCSCIDGSAAKMSRTSVSLELKESDVLYSSWLREREREREQEREVDALL